MSNAVTVSLLAGNLILTAILIAQWLAGPDVHSMATDIDHLKAELHGALWKIDELEKFILKTARDEKRVSDPPPYDWKIQEPEQKDHSEPPASSIDDQALPGPGPDVKAAISGALKKAAKTLAQFAPAKHSASITELTDLAQEKISSWFDSTWKQINTFVPWEQSEPGEWHIGGNSFSSFVRFSVRTGHHRSPTKTDK